ncbi:MAG TPA: hybrid sensor histidine kinase/response regulator [Trichocoleus sp.]
MRIEDDELRDLFKTTSEERIQAIDSGLLELEQHPDNLATVEAILREAHSLKGDSNMLGQEALGRLAHQIEHILGAVKRGEQLFTADMADRLGHGMAAIRKLVEEAVTGTPAGINPFYVLAELMGGAPASAERPVAPDTTEPTTEPVASDFLTEPTAAAPPIDSGDENLELAAMAIGTAASQEKKSDQPVRGLAAAAASHSGYRIETVRVPTHHLDSLMTQSGELTVTKIRVAHRLTEVEAISNLWEEWNRDVFVNRFLLDDCLANSASARQIQDFFSRVEAHIEQLGALTQRLHSTLYEDVTRLELISGELEEGIRTLRLLPLSTIFNLFPRMVRDLARQEGKSVNLVISGGETKADKRILEEMKDPLLHMLRNAIDHGIESPEERVRQGKPEQATLHLRGYQTGNTIVLEVSDDGRGLETEAIKEMAMRKGLYRAEELDTLTPEQIQALILSPGFSTRLQVTEVSGRGVGLDVLRTNVERLKGHIEVESQPGQGCTLRVRLGTTLATAHVLIVAVGGISYALPVEFVETARQVRPSDVFTVKNQPSLIHLGQPISVVSLAEILDMPASDSLAQRGDETRPLSCIVLRVGGERLGVFVDALIDEQDVVLKPQSQLLKRVRNIAGATILGTGEVCMVLNPQDFIQSVRRGGSCAVATNAIAPAAALHTQRAVLLVEDSIATRTQEKRILEAAGYAVVTAVDGVDGFNKLQTQHFDAVVSDVQMPHLDGLGLTARIRQNREYAELPVILVTTLASDEDRRRGAEAGANAYITKSSFNQGMLLDTLERLI